MKRYRIETVVDFYSSLQKSYVRRRVWKGKRWKNNSVEQNYYWAVKQ